jgi:hypothetical protein
VPEDVKTVQVMPRVDPAALAPSTAGAVGPAAQAAPAPTGADPDIERTRSLRLPVLMTGGATCGRTRQRQAEVLPDA